MKKVFAFALAAGMFAVVACGPSAQEKAEKAKQDSIKGADSIAAAQKVIDDSLAALTVDTTKVDTAKVAEVK